jgi:hypothetical protein
MCTKSSSAGLETQSTPHLRLGCEMGQQHRGTENQPILELLQNLLENKIKTCSLAFKGTS